MILKFIRQFNIIALQQSAQHGLPTAYRRFFRSEKNHAVLGLTPWAVLNTLRRRAGARALPQRQVSRNVVRNKYG